MKKKIKKSKRPSSYTPRDVPRTAKTTTPKGKREYQRWYMTNVYLPKKRLEKLQKTKVQSMVGLKAGKL